MIKKFFQGKSLAFYLCLGACVIGLINVIIYASYSLNVVGKNGNHFNLTVFMMLLFGCLTCLLPLIKSEWKFTILIPAAFYSAAFGYYINDRLIMFEEMINRIYGMMESGAVLEMVIVIFVLNIICVLLTIVSCFMELDKKDLVSIETAK